MGEIFSVTAIVVSLLIGAGGAILALIVRLVKGDGADALWRMLETFLTGMFGAFLAHTFIYLMLWAGGHGDAAVTVTSLFFFIWPGIVNGVAHLATGHPVIGEPGVLWIALFVGGGIGIMDGLWATHRWLGLGPLAFLLDVTWGLGGSTNGLLLHLIDSIIATHADGTSENRNEAHRYVGGFHIKSGYVFTQGAVMSDAGGAPVGADLYWHETIHTWQNRVLGPFYWMSYVGWMIVLFIPALIAGAIKNRIADAINWWTYYNNSWEVMAYGIADHTDRDQASSDRWLCWPWALVVALNAVVTVGFGALFVMTFASVYG